MLRTTESFGLNASPAANGLELESRGVGALPLMNRFLEWAGVDEALQRFLPEPSSRERLSPAVGVGVLLRNLLVSRELLYNLRDGCRRSEEFLLRLPTGGAEWLHEDRLGMGLDKPFDADHAALMTAIVGQAARVFELNLEQLHDEALENEQTMEGIFPFVRNDRHLSLQVMNLFADVRGHRLLSPSGISCRMFQDQLTQSQAPLLQMLSISPSRHFAGIRETPRPSQKA